MMRLPTILLTITNAFWLGGLVTLFLLTGYLRRHDPAVATRAAPHIFAAFETYHLVLAGLTLLLIVTLWAMTARSHIRLATTLCLAVAIATAVISAAFITPRLAQLRRDGQTDTPAFIRGHYASLTCYGIESLAMLGATALLPAWNPRRKGKLQADRSADAAAPPLPSGA